MHLLVVEDDPRLGRLLLRLFNEDRHVVELAVTGEDGLDVADRLQALDAIVLDVGLPDLDGLEVARRMRAHGSRTPIIMLTARDGLAVVIGAVSGLYPAIRAARTPPTEALRTA